MRWQQIDFETNKLRVNQAAWRTTTKSPKTLTSHRTIELGPKLVEELKCWKLECLPTKEGYVFPTRNGLMISHHKISIYGMKPAIEKSNVYWDGNGIHAFRHYFASAMIAVGKDPRWIMSKLGHSTIVMTFNTYGHLFDLDEDVGADIEKATMV